MKVAYDKSCGFEPWSNDKDYMRRQPDLQASTHINMKLRSDLVVVLASELEGRGFQILFYRKSTVYARLVHNPSD
ncbi:hypothetical protein AVEN_208666-1 [Araneus ventricosus]|uniref:Uncharacterized protein n=1 Tax=Araneus ventricosus TaxID=182803 RepID=A0A4Y2DU27_ARAVE|nr:hypothetical protein AVEN_208666-1 [Araneus ventricosus]